MKNELKPKDLVIQSNRLVESRMEVPLTLIEHKLAMIAIQHDADFMNSLVENIESLPGGTLMAHGFEDLKDGRETTASLLLSIAKPKLQAMGLKLNFWIDEPEKKLYLQLSNEYGDQAHKEYNTLIRRLISFEKTLFCVI
jgi:ATPase subunit of ABC transporter with duplicated ATPase domains